MLNSLIFKQIDQRCYKTKSWVLILMTGDFFFPLKEMDDNLFHGNFPEYCAYLLGRDRKLETIHRSFQVRPY